VATPKQTDPQFKLRMTSQLRDQIEAAAKSNNRSMNAEIVDRLEASFEPASMMELIGAYERKLNEAIEVNKYLEELKVIHEKMLDDMADGAPTEAALPSENTLYVALDVNGLPLSWPEVMKHLGEIGKAGKFDIRSIHAVAVDLGDSGRQDRDAAYLKLVRDYRKLRKAAEPERLSITNIRDIQELVEELKAQGYI
jgi:hypothetical protein